jgi:hypothetical protein
MPSQSRDQQGRKSLVITQHLALKGMKVEELRELAGVYISPGMNAENLSPSLADNENGKP